VPKRFAPSLRQTSFGFSTFFLLDLDKIKYTNELASKLCELQSRTESLPCPSCTLLVRALYSFQFTSHNLFRGIYLTNLTFTEDGNPDLLNGLINFKKRKLVSRVPKPGPFPIGHHHQLTTFAQIIVEIQKFQVGKKYNFSKVDSIVDFLDSLPEEEDEELYSLSLLREPRVAKK